MSIVTLMLVIPLAGTALILAGARQSAGRAHAMGISATAATLLAALVAWSRGMGASGFSLVAEHPWIPTIGAAYRVGVDGISLPLVLLTAFLFLAVTIYSAHIRERAATYVIWLLLLETASIGTFVALDGLLFYVFFEVSLVAMYFLIAGWGHEDRQRAALLFFMYTLLGSLPLLLAILGLYLGSTPHTFDMRIWIAHPPLSGAAAMLALIAMLVTFAVKIPVFPFHTWLPVAHVEAPAAGSVILAGVMLKFGTYGLVRFALQMIPAAFHAAAVAILALGAVSALYGAFAALAQTDLKRLIAYTSVNHMGYVVVAVAIAALARDPQVRSLALDGAVLQMVSHGLVTGVLFLLVGALQERTHTRDMSAYGGLLAVIPALGWSFVLAAFASLGLPGLAHFPAEFQIFLATLEVAPWALVVLFGLAITAALYLRAIARTFFGALPARWAGLPDLGMREWLSIGPVLAVIGAVGVDPSWVLDVVHHTTAAWLR